MEWRGRSPAQWFCLVGGAALLVRGAVGVALDPVFEAPGEGWHQLIHFSSGVLLLAVAREARAALALTLAFATFYATVTVVGLIDGADVVSVIPVAASDNGLHSFLTLTSLIAGLLTLRAGRSAPSPS